MALFSGRASMFEVQNRALIKTAGERAQRISELKRELQRAVQEVERLRWSASTITIGSWRWSNTIARSATQYSLMGPEAGA